jgi:hypothetical protein
VSRNVGEIAASTKGPSSPPRPVNGLRRGQAKFDLISEHSDEISFKLEILESNKGVLGRRIEERGQEGNIPES